MNKQRPRYITKSTAKNILALYYGRIKFGRLSRTLIFLLGIRPMTRSYICEFMEQFFKVSRKYTQHFVSDLHNKQIIEKFQDQFRLTDYGKIFFLMCDYEISFIQMSLLLESFQCESRMKKENCKTCFFLISNFIDKVDFAFTSEYVMWNVSQLLKKRLIYKHHKGAVSVMPEISMELLKCMNSVEFFHNWFIDVWRRKRILILSDPLVMSKQHDLCYQHIS
ncbi:MAG TPA: hypothetical protein VFM31_06545 [Nitrososphaeraceae archaeon]|nr:hypothetical protein [Nitrososphaeraceae archaeon]